MHEYLGFNASLNGPDRLGSLWGGYRKLKSKVSALQKAGAAGEALLAGRENLLQAQNDLLQAQKAVLKTQEAFVACGTERAEESAVWREYRECKSIVEKLLLEEKSEEIWEELLQSQEALLEILERLLVAPLWREYSNWKPRVVDLMSTKRGLETTREKSGALLEGHESLLLKTEESLLVAEQRLLNVEEALLAYYREDIECMAKFWKRKLGTLLELSEIVSAANSGARKAMEGFDVNRGVFHLFARKSMKGEILARLEKGPLGDARKTLAKTEEDLLKHYERDPEDSEICKHLGWNEAKLKKVRLVTEIRKPDSLEMLFENGVEFEFPEPNASSGPDDDECKRNEKLLDLVDKLPPGQRNAITLAYLRESRLKDQEAANELNITCGAFRRSKSGAMANLRRMLGWFDLILLFEEALPAKEERLVVVAMTEGDLRIRIFDAKGEAFTKEETDLIPSAELNELKHLFGSGSPPDVSKWPQGRKQYIIDCATSVSCYPKIGGGRSYQDL